MKLVEAFFVGTKPDGSKEVFQGSRNPTTETHPRFKSIAGPFSEEEAKKMAGDEKKEALKRELMGELSDGYVSCTKCGVVPEKSCPHSAPFKSVTKKNESSGVVITAPGAGDTPETLLKAIPRTMDASAFISHIGDLVVAGKGAAPTDMKLTGEPITPSDVTMMAQCKIGEAENVFDKHALKIAKDTLKIAKDTLKMHPAVVGVMGGTTHEGAHQTIKRITGKDQSCTQDGCPYKQTGKTESRELREGSSICNCGDSENDHYKDPPSSCSRCACDSFESNSLPDKAKAPAAKDKPVDKKESLKRELLGEDNFVTCVGCGKETLSRDAANLNDRGKWASPPEGKPHCRSCDMYGPPDNGGKSSPGVAGYTSREAGSGPAKKNESDAYDRDFTCKMCGKTDDGPEFVVAGKHPVCKACKEKKDPDKPIKLRGESTSNDKNCQACGASGASPRDRGNGRVLNLCSTCTSKKAEGAVFASNASLHKKYPGPAADAQSDKARKSVPNTVCNFCTNPVTPPATVCDTCYDKFNKKKESKEKPMKTKPVGEQFHALANAAIKMMVSIQESPRAGRVTPLLARLDKVANKAADAVAAKMMGENQGYEFPALFKELKEIHAKLRTAMGEGWHMYPALGLGNDFNMGGDGREMSPELSGVDPVEGMVAAAVPLDAGANKMENVNKYVDSLLKEDDDEKCDTCGGVDKHDRNKHDADFKG